MLEREKHTIDLLDSLWHFARKLEAKKCLQKGLCIEVLNVVPVRIFRGVVKSGSTPVGGPVKSGQKWTKDKGRGLDKKLVRPELVTTWIQRLRTTSIDPLHRFRSRGLRRIRRRRRRQAETGVVTKLISD